MEFLIYSLGSGSFLESVLVALQLMAGKETGINYYWVLGSIGVACGAVIMGVQSIYGGGQSLKGGGQFIAGCIIFCACFGTTANVKIYDIDLGSTIAVDDVPLGIALAGYIISTAGYGITQLMETSFYAIGEDSSDSGYRIGNHLKKIYDLRAHVNQDQVWRLVNSKISETGEPDARRTIEEYMVNCTLAAVDIQKKAVTTLFQQDIQTAMLWDSELYTTRVFDGTDQFGAYKTCTEAKTDISDIFDNLKSADVRQAIADQLHIKSASYVGTVSSAMTAVGMIGASAENYVIANQIKPIFEKAAMQKHASMMDTNAALSIRAQLERRNYTWAAESTFFAETIKPFIAFFEGFTYAMAPFIAIFLAMSSFGTQIAMKYFQTLVWIQLWWPCAAIINLYMVTTSSGEMASLVLQADGATPAMSFYYIDSTFDVASTWLAIGAKMMASIPVLTFAMLTGSAYSFNSLLDKFGAANAAAASAVANNLSPVPMTLSNVMSKGSLFNYNHSTGAFRAESSLADPISLKSGISSAATQQRASSDMWGTTSALTSTLNTMLTKSGSTADTSTFKTALGANLQSTLNDTFGVTSDQITTFMKNNGLSGQDTNKFLADLALNAGTNGLGAKFSVGSGSTAASTSMTQLAKSLGINDTEGLSAALSKSLTSTITEESAKTSTYTDLFSNADGLSEQVTKAVQQTQQYVTSQNLQQDQGLSIDRRLNNSPELLMHPVQGILQQIDASPTKYTEGLVAAAKTFQSAQLNQMDLYRNSELYSGEADGGHSRLRATAEVLNNFLSSSDDNQRELGEMMLTQVAKEAGIGDFQHINKDVPDPELPHQDQVEGRLKDTKKFYDEVEGGLSAIKNQANGPIDRDKILDSLQQDLFGVGAFNKSQRDEVIGKAASYKLDALEKEGANMVPQLLPGSQIGNIMQFLQNDPDGRSYAETLFSAIATSQAGKVVQDSVIDTLKVIPGLGGLSKNAAEYAPLLQGIGAVVGAVYSKEITDYSIDALNKQTLGGPSSREYQATLGTRDAYEKAHQIFSEGPYKDLTETQRQIAASYYSGFRGDDQDPNFRDNLRQTLYRVHGEEKGDNIDEMISAMSIPTMSEKSSFLIANSLGAYNKANATLNGQSEINQNFEKDAVATGQGYNLLGSQEIQQAKEFVPGVNPTDPIIRVEHLDEHGNSQPKYYYWDNIHGNPTNIEAPPTDGPLPKLNTSRTGGKLQGPNGENLVSFVKDTDGNATFNRYDHEGAITNSYKLYLNPETIPEKQPLLSASKVPVIAP